MGISNFLKQPYPYYYQKKGIWLYSAIVFAFTFVFYYVFLPFEINTKEHKYSFVGISAIHALVPFILMPIQGYLYQYRLRKARPWKVSDEFIFYGIFLFLTGLAQYLIRDIIYENPHNRQLKYVLEELRNTFLIGGIFIAIAVSVNFNRLYHKHIQKAGVLAINDPTVFAGRHITIHTQVKSESFDLRIDQFLFARSDGNYLNIFLQSDKETTSTLKRLTLNDLKNQIEKVGNFMQTHRSYLVNLDKLEQVTGNAAGFTLTFQHCTETALVSRKLIRSFETQLKATKSRDSHP